MLDAMRAAGLSPAKELDLRPDGRLIRFRVEGDKSGSRNGWAVLHSGRISAGAFGSWRTGESHTWCERDTGALTQEERLEAQRQFEAARRQRAEEQAMVHEEARARAERLLAASRPADARHPYLQAKRIRGHSIRQLRNALVIPARDASGTLHTLQFIGPDGGKRFLTGGRIRGCYFALGAVRSVLLLAEGVATGCTLHEATGEAVAVCFNCGNLEAVAIALRAKFPRLPLIVCADNDSQTPGNPGLAHARAAARATGACVAVPNFEGVVN